MLRHWTLLAVEDSIGTRLMVCLVCVVVGAILILVGINDVRTQKAEEAGKARLTNSLLGVSNTYEGKKAVALGVVRIASGVAAIIFGIVFIFVGPFLAR